MYIVGLHYLYTILVFGMCILYMDMFKVLISRKLARRRAVASW